ncbi:hypothetical protein BJY04DRAFT_181702 [Aspergillus karnatakaensis]|uniref:uncharacterized protein n=1 Tax=Aspergillus karnatakaensis TaxID=1810916 RepID=UPI003CCC9203
MLPCGRPALKKCGLSVSTAPNPGFRHSLNHNRSSLNHEPLLFLYPRWFSASVRQQKRAAYRAVSARNARGTSRSREINARGRTRTLTRGQTRTRSRTRTGFISMLTRRKLLGPNLQDSKTLSATATSSTESQIATETGVPADGEQRRLVGDDGKFSPFLGLEKAMGLRPKSSSFRAPTWGFVARLKTARKRLALARKSGDLDTTLEGSEETIQQDATESSPDRVKPDPRSHLRHLTPLQRNRVLRRSVQLRSSPVKGRHSIYVTLKKLLERAERQGAAEVLIKSRSTKRSDLARRELLAPDETIAAIAGVSHLFSEAENIFYVRLLNGCRVQVLAANESEGQYRKIIIWGTDQATKLLETRIKRIQKLQENGDPLLEPQKPLVPVFPSLMALERKGIPKPLVRGVWTSGPWRTPPDIVSLVDQLDKVSSVKDFLAKTEALTRPREGKHSQLVHNALSILFDSEDKKHLVSTAALNHAISYLFQNGHPKGAMHLLECAGHVATVDTFNIVLKSLAQHQNLFGFGRHLQRMIAARIQPDAVTWLTFLDCLISPLSKASVVGVMRKRRYLENRYIARKVLYSTIQEIFMADLKKGKSVDEFFESITKNAATNYFPGHVIKRMFSVTSQLKDLSGTYRLLDICRENMLPLTSMAIGDLIRSIPDNTVSALNLVFPVLESTHGRLQMKAFEQLFFHAFRNQNYNICRVLWRYACMQGKTSNLMRNQLSFYLTQNKPTTGQTEEEGLWHVSAAKVIVGVCFHLRKDRKLLSLIPKEFHDNPLASIINSGPTDGELRQRQRAIARAMLKHDVEIGKWYRPMYSLAHMLDAAAVLDAEWKGVPRPTQWLVQNAIEVPVKLGSVS